MKTVCIVVCLLAAYHLLGETNNRSKPVSANVKAIAARGREQGVAGAGAKSGHDSGGFWLERKVMNPEFMKKVGITDEQLKTLQAAWKKLEEQRQKLEEDIHLLAREQAELAKKVLSQPGSDTQELMNLVEKIGKLRTEQAKVAMQRVILIRDHLTAEQRKQLNTLLEEDQKKWRAARDEAGRRREPALGAGQKKSVLKVSESSD